jgi:hypothetical protein
MGVSGAGNPTVGAAMARTRRNSDQIEIVESIFGVLYLAARRPRELRSNLRGTI